MAQISRREQNAESRLKSSDLWRLRARHIRKQFFKGNEHALGSTVELLSGGRGMAKAIKALDREIGKARKSLLICQQM